MLLHDDTIKRDSDIAAMIFSPPRLPGGALSHADCAVHHIYSVRGARCSARRPLPIRAWQAQARPGPLKTSRGEAWTKAPNVEQRILLSADGRQSSRRWEVMAARSSQELMLSRVSS